MRTASPALQKACSWPALRFSASVAAATGALAFLFLAGALDSPAEGGGVAWDAVAPSQSPRSMAVMHGASKIPLPPARPRPVSGRLQMVATASGVAPLLRAADVPAVITQGLRLRDAPTTAGPALAYASTTDRTTTSIRPVGRSLLRGSRGVIAPAVGLRALPSHKPVAFVAVRLDLSDVRCLLGPTPIARATGESDVGTAIDALPKAGRFSVAQLAFGTPSVVVARFGSVVSDMRTRDFTGPAIRPLGLLFTEFSSARPARTRQIDQLAQRAVRP